jgi:hypothetical protein
MGYLRLNSGSPANLNSGIFSCWVFIPSSVRTALMARDPTSTTSDSLTLVMNQCIPFITFGSQQTSIEYDYDTSDGACDDGAGGSQVVGRSFVSGNYPVPVQQSFIGVQFINGSSYDPVLAVHIQGANGAHCTGWQTSSGPGVVCEYFPGGSLKYYGAAHTDESYVGNLPQYAFIGNTLPTLRNRVPSGTPALALDQWQQVTVSWSLRPESGASDFSPNGMASNGAGGTSLLYCAVNDVNKSGYDLPAAWPGLDDDSGYAPNACLSSIIYAVADTVAQHTSDPDHSSDYHPFATLAWGNIRSSPIWIPGPPTIAIDDDRGTSLSPNLGIIMADLQLFAGIAIDTSVTDNRRLFITDEGKPAALSVASTALGRQPIIALKGTTNWQQGKNKGSGGNLTPFGTINEYGTSPGL